MTNNIFATAINCIDGRVQVPVINWLRRQYGADYVDMITEPGPERLLVEGKDLMAIALIRRSLEISVNHHNSKIVAIVGHYDCVGNPSDKVTQLEQILTAIKTIKAWKFDVKVIGLRIDEDWEVREVY
jgi:hypothetical protein